MVATSGAAGAGGGAPNLAMRTEDAASAVHGLGMTAEDYRSRLSALLTDIEPREAAIRAGTDALAQTFAAQSADTAHVKQALIALGQRMDTTASVGGNVVGMYGETEGAVESHVSAVPRNIV